MTLVFNQEAINGILFTLHFYNELPTVAHQKLLQMTGKEVMNLSQVTEFFEKINNGEFRLEEDVKEKKSEAKLAQIVNVPDFVEKYLDIDTRLRLRKTCTTIRGIINEKLLDIDCLHYKCKNNCIEISTNGNFKVTYKIIQGGLSVKYWDRVILINAKNEEELIEIIQRGLMSILCSEKLRIDTLKIEDCERPELDGGEPPIGLRALRNTFNQVPNKLKIRKLKYCVPKLDKVFIETLKTIDAEHLKFVTLTFKINFFNTVCDDLYNLEEWKRLKSLNVCYPQLRLSDIICSYTHFENARLKIYSYHDVFSDSTTPLQNSIMMIKDKLLQNPTLKQFKMRVNDWMSDYNLEDMNAILQQYNTNNNPYPCWVTIPYPNSDKKLEMLVKKEMIWFKGPCYVEGEDSDDDYDYEERDFADEEELNEILALFSPLPFLDQHDMLEGEEDRNDDDEEENGVEDEEESDEESEDEDEIPPLNA